MAGRRSRGTRGTRVLMLTVASVLLGAVPAHAGVQIVSTAQCRATSCIAQLIFTAKAAGTATVTAGGVSKQLSVRAGSSRRLVRVTGATTTFGVRVAFAGTTTSRAVTRRQMPVNAAPNTCATLAPTAATLSVGPTSDQTKAYLVPSRGTVRIAVIFVDFSDAPATQPTSAPLTSWLTPGLRWLATSSYGRVSLTMSPLGTTWVRMPKPSTAYGMNDGTTYEEHKAYVGDAIAAADPTTDFSGVNAVYVVGSAGVAISRSPTFHGAPGTFVADGQQLGPAVTFGSDASTWGKTLVAHETGHLFGLPDLYAFSGTGQFRFVGVWDVMGDIFEATDLTAWQRRKLDWLSAGQMLCATPTGMSWAVLSPLGTAGDVKAMFIRTGAYTGMVVENRQRVGNDRGICRPGALVYSVDSRVNTGEGPIRVAGGDATGAGCGYGNRSDATLVPGQSITRGNVTIRVLGAQSGKLEVTVNRS